MLGACLAAGDEERPYTQLKLGLPDLELGGDRHPTKDCPLMGMLD
jgi:hypothetical protein